MKQLLISRPGSVSVKEAPIPAPAFDQVCIQVRASGLCGTDVHIFHGGFAPAYPVIPGHEFVGEVVAIGPECRRIQVGMRVAVEPNVPCNNCEYCLKGQHHYCINMEVPGVNQPGGMAEYTLVRERGVFDVGNLDFRLAAFTEPLSCVIHSQDRLGILLGQQILILGAGPIGMLHGIVAAKNGANTIDFVEINEDRRQRVARYGWGQCFDNLDEVDQDYDIVIDATGISKLQSLGIKKLQPQGKLLIFGVPKEGSELKLDHYHLFRQEIQIIGSFTSIKDSFRAIDFIRKNHERIAELISHEVTLEEVASILTEKIKLSDSLKIMVTT